MSENNKPLIFLEPLSQTLKKLKEVLEENSESEGIEIFDVESVEEASQLIPTIGQAVILTASPKTCAVTLQTNRKYIKKLQTKTLLLTPKAIPRKTLDKFMKVGLTECIVEPVNPKTLLYKVRLQLRSITAEKPEDDGEMQKKFGEDSANEAIDTQAKVRAEKGVILDDESEDSTPRQRKEMAEETLEDYSKPKKKRAAEESIDGFYRGKQKRAEEDFDDEEEPQKKKGYQEEAIEGHYKGKLDKTELEIEEEALKREKLEIPEMEEDLEAIKRQVNLEVEEDYNKKKRSQIEEIEEFGKKEKSASLDIDEDEDEDNQNSRSKEREDLGGHYKGDVNKSALDIEDDEDEINQEREAEQLSHLKGKSSPHLNIDDDEEAEYLDKNEESHEAISAKKKSPSLNIDEDEDQDHIQKAELNIIDTQESKDHTVEEEDYEEIKKKKSTALSIEEESEDEIDAKKVDNIDGYLRGGKAKKNIDIEDDEDLYKDEKAEEEKERKRKEMASLDLYDDSQKDPLLDEKEYPEDDSRKKKRTALDLYDEGLDSDAKEKAGHEDSEYDRARSSYQEDESGGFGARHAAHTENKKDRHNKSNSRADQIKTHYDSRHGIKHGEGNWDSNWEKAGVAEQEFGASKKENEISYESQDLGEQTIDYAQLKKEFEGMDLSDVAKKKKEYGEFNHIAEIKTFTKTVLSPTGSLESMEFEEVQVSEEEEESQQVFLPDSKGIETVIEVLNFYQKDEVQISSIYNFITMKLDFLFKGDLSLYIVDEKNALDLIHIGAVMRQAGIAPKRPLEEDAMDKKDFKLLMKEYDEEDKEYRANALIFQNNWKEKWESRLPQWQATQTPTWRDQTFQEEDNEFIFPFYEGVSLLGLAIFTPHTKFDESKSGALEVAMESLRAPILSEYHATRGQGKQRTKTVAAPQEPKGVKGFFNKWFGKKAS